MFVRVRTEDIVDVTTFFLDIADNTNGCTITNRNIDHAFEQVTDITAMGQAAIDAEARCETAGIRLVRDDANCARLRIRAECRALRAGKHLDLLNIVNVRVHVGI